MIDLDRIKALLGDLARPYALYATATATAYSIFTIAPKVTGGEAGAFVIGAAGVILTALYAGKVIENNNTAKRAAEVKIATAATQPAQPAPGTATITAAADVDVSVRDAETGELPANERIKP